MNGVQASAADWLHIVRGEFQEIPGLHLTKPQVQRLWGLDAATCDELLDSLMRFLRRTYGEYARVAAGHWTRTCTVGIDVSRRITHPSRRRVAIDTLGRARLKTT